MLKIKIFFTLLISIAVIQSVKADDVKKELRKYINDVITEAKEAEDPADKREILNNLFIKLNNSLETAQTSFLVPAEDLKGVELYREKVIEKYNELNGLNGFEKVPDISLNEFANYSMQDFEQADTVLTISLTTLLLIIILAILIF